MTAARYRSRPMNAITAPSSKVDLSGLIQAITHATADDSMNNVLTAEQWDWLSAYLLPISIPSGQVLFAKGTNDRTLYLVESGSLSVHFEDEKQRLRLAIVGPGSMVGEGAFFSHRARNASVQANASCRLWSMSPLRFAEMSHRRPELALAITLALAGVMARRVPSRRRRVAVT